MVDVLCLACASFLSPYDQFLTLVIVNGKYHLDFSCKRPGFIAMSLLPVRNDSAPTPLSIKRGMSDY
jgi:hypothetical protein